MAAPKPRTKNPAELADKYLDAKDIYENTQIGPRTDRAWDRMEAIIARADELGIYPQFLAQLNR